MIAPFSRSIEDALFSRTLSRDRFAEVAARVDLTIRRHRPRRYRVQDFLLCVGMHVRMRVYVCNFNLIHE